MGRYFLTQDAKGDFTHIRKYTIKRWGKEKSKSYLLDMRKTLIMLVDNPMMGTERTDIGIGVYSFPYVSHMIYYSLVSDGIVVFAILHGAMVPENHLPARLHE